MDKKRLIRWLAFVAGLLVAQVAVSQAPAGAPAGATGLCKDGTYYTGASKSGACRGHQGVKDWYGAPASATSSKKTAASEGTSATTTSKSSASTSSKKGTAASEGTSSTTTATKPAATSAAGPRPADATGLCKDGTYYTGASKSGACRGHQGVKDWYGAPATVATGAKSASTSTSAPASSATSKPAPASAPAPAQAAQSSPATTSKNSTSTMAQAAGGGAGQVWLNTASNVYHCPGSRYYGKTKTGAYMTEAEAKAKGAHPDRGQPCK